MIAGFYSDLRTAFEAPKKSGALSCRTANFNVVDDGFTEVDPSDLDSASIMTPATTERFPPRPALLDSLPNVNAIERPEDLLKKPPYYLIVSHASHGKRWVKRNHNQTTKVRQSIPANYGYLTKPTKASCSGNHFERIMFWARLAL